MAATGILDLARELVFPSQCALCGTPSLTGDPLCDKCLGSLELISGSRCDICGEAFAPGTDAHTCGDCATERPNFEEARAWLKFQAPVNSIIHLFKYKRGFYFLDWMVSGMVETFRREYAGREFDLVAPIPLHWRRLLTRGYNQALILAKPIGRKLKMKVAPGALSRTGNTPPQVGLSRNQRKENLKKAFAIKDPKRVAGKKILLVDDVITTGATVDEAARVLKKAGAREVRVLAFGRT